MQFVYFCICALHLTTYPLCPLDAIQSALCELYFPTSSVVSHALRKRLQTPGQRSASNLSRAVAPHEVNHCFNECDGKSSHPSPSNQYRILQASQLHITEECSSLGKAKLPEASPRIGWDALITNENRGWRSSHPHLSSERLFPPSNWKQSISTFSCDAVHQRKPLNYFLFGPFLFKQVSTPVRPSCTSLFRGSCM